jgi:hypothetical protein
MKAVNKPDKPNRQEFMTAVYLTLQVEEQAKDGFRLGGARRKLDELNESNELNEDTSTDSLL